MSFGNFNPSTESKPVTSDSHKQEKQIVLSHGNRIFWKVSRVPDGNRTYPECSTNMKERNASRGTVRTKGINEDGVAVSPARGGGRYHL